MTAIGRERQAGVQGIASACIVGGIGGLTMKDGTPHDRLGLSQAVCAGTPAMSASAWERSSPSGSPSEFSASAGRHGRVPAKAGNTVRPVSSSGSSDLPAALGGASVRHAAHHPGRAAAAVLLGRALPAWRRRGRFISIMSTSAAIIGTALFSRWGNFKSEISPMMRLEQAIQENA